MNRQLGLLVCAVALLPLVFVGVAAEDSDQKRKLDLGVQGILDGLFSATQDSLEAMGDQIQVVGDTIKTKVNDRVDLAKDTAGIMKDTASIITSLLTDDLKDVDIKKNLVQTESGLRSSMRNLNSLILSLAKVLKNAAPSMPSVETLKNPKSWPSSLMEYGKQLTGAVDEVASSFGSVYEGISAKYCKAGGYDPSIKKPGYFRGVGMSLTVSSGSCILTGDKSSKGEHIINCTAPYIEMNKTPIKFVSKHHTAPSFTSKECKITKDFGKSIDETILTFDHPDDKSFSDNLKKASDKANKDLQALSGAYKQIPKNMEQFIKEVPEETGEVVSKYDEGTVQAAMSVIDSIVDFNAEGAARTVQSIPSALGWKVNQV